MIGARCVISYENFYVFAYYSLYDIVSLRCVRVYLPMNDPYLGMFAQQIIGVPFLPP